jgi:hypothetical protein
MTEYDIASAFKQNGDDIERNEKLITMFERRRNASYRDLEQLRNSPGSKTSQPPTIDLTGQEIDDDNV